MRRAAKTDNNQKSIVEGLRALGATVQPLHVLGQGCPDILVGYQGKNYLMEIKTKRGKLTPDEENWHWEWRGTVHVVKTFDEATDVLLGVVG